MVFTQDIENLDRYYSANRNVTSVQPLALRHQMYKQLIVALDENGNLLNDYQSYLKP